ncbi:hypothetical protein, partial [uncultured Clostridium sp.]|uniref:hypothetical protein n=1 Tax=uncultured Clostridium sp. TaxID=59620 RepID=UPI00262AD337
KNKKKRISAFFYNGGMGTCVFTGFIFTLLLCTQFKFFIQLKYKKLKNNFKKYLKKLLFRDCF